MTLTASARVVELALAREGHRLLCDLGREARSLKRERRPCELPASRVVSAAAARTAPPPSGASLAVLPPPPQAARRSAATASDGQAGSASHQYFRSCGLPLRDADRLAGRAPGRPSTQRDHRVLEEVLVVTGRVVVRPGVRAAALLPRDAAFEHAGGHVEHEAELDRLRQVVVEHRRPCPRRRRSRSAPGARPGSRPAAASGPRAGRPRSSRASSAPSSSRIAYGRSPSVPVEQRLHLPLGVSLRATRER